MAHEESVNNQAIKRNINGADGSILAVETGLQEHVVRVEKTSTLQQMYEAPILVNTNASGCVLVDSYTPLGQ